MKKLLRPTCGVVLASLLLIGILYAKASTTSAESTPEVLVEAMIVQVSTDALAKLQVEVSQPLSEFEVRVPLPVLLYVLAKPNAVKTISSAKIKVPTGQTGMVNTGHKVEYLIETDEGLFEQKTTDMPIGTTLEASPTIVLDGNILLKFRFEHFTIESAEKTDTETSLPIGRPIINSITLDNRVKLKSGETMIVGSMEKTNSIVFILVRAEILTN